jgi:Porin subfamily
MKCTVAGKRVMAMSPASPGAIPLIAIAVTIASALLMGIVVDQAAAQTLTNPNPPAKWSAPHGAAKAHTSAQTKKSCKEFGAGFVNVAGTDTCVKIGGFVTVEGGTRGR